MKLTERAGRGITPTPAGVAYARYATDVLALLKEGSDVAVEVASGAGRHLRIKAVTTAGEYLLPPLVRAFRERRPMLEVSVHVGNRQEVFRRPRSSRGRRGDLGARPGGRRPRGVPFLDNESSHHCARRSSRAAPVAVDELAAVPWLMRGGSGTAACASCISTRISFTPPLLTLGSNGAIKNAARMGLQDRASVS